MADLDKRIRDILTKMQLASLATITEDGKPWTRYVMTKGADDFSVRCATFLGSRKIAQIDRNPEVHVTCGITDPTKLAAYLQIQGTAAYTSDEKERHAFWNESLKEVFEGPDDPKYVVLVITPHRIELCSPGEMKPEVWEAEGAMGDLPSL